MDEATYQLIDGILGDCYMVDRDRRQDIIRNLGCDERHGYLKLGCKVIGERYCLNPKRVMEWYNERKTRLL